jgi:hypothetical protein
MGCLNLRAYDAPEDKDMRRLWLVAVVAALGFLVIPSEASAASFVQCPGVGANPNGCQFLITFNADGTITTAASTTDTGPFDNSEDTLIGIQNNTGAAITSLVLTSATLQIFGFDGDGACQAGFYSPQPACTGHDSTGYGGFVSATSTGLGSAGPLGAVTFGGITANLMSGTVTFGPTGIPAGGSAWFSLEEAITLNSLPTPGTVPEPATLTLLGTGIFAVARRLRRA